MNKNFNKHTECFGKYNPGSKIDLSDDPISKIMRVYIIIRQCP